MHNHSSWFFFTCALLLSTVLAQPAEPPLRKQTSVELPGPKGSASTTSPRIPTTTSSSSLTCTATKLISWTRAQTRWRPLSPTLPAWKASSTSPTAKRSTPPTPAINTIGVIDVAQKKVVKKLKTEAKPDGSTYAAPFHKLYVSDERGNAEAIVDTRSDTIVKTLHFESETGMPQYDAVAKLVYVNLQDINRFAVIDPQEDRVVAQYPVGRCKGNHGMALDPERHRAFLVCEENDLLAVFDLDKH